MQTVLFADKETNDPEECHGIKWYPDKDNLTKNGIGKPVAPHHWRLKSQYDSLITSEGSNQEKQLQPFDVFIMLFPRTVLKETVCLMN